jgi:prepilin-type N-terminal cleavage/methylation domain-containing protein
MSKNTKIKTGKRKTNRGIFSIFHLPFSIFYSRKARGMTLLEMVVTVSIVSIIMIAISDSVRFFYRANTSSIEQSYQIASARRGTEFLVRDLREASHGDDGSYPLALIGSTTISFFSDTDKDVLVERIRYELTGTVLTRAVLEASGAPSAYTGVENVSIVSEYVRNFEEGAAIFQYFDAGGNEITDYNEVDEVRSVTVNLVVNIQPIRAPEEFTLRSSATLRNLRNE